MIDDRTIVIWTIVNRPIIVGGGFRVSSRIARLTMMIVNRLAVDRPIVNLPITNPAAIFAAVMIIARFRARVDNAIVNSAILNVGLMRSRGCSSCLPA